MHAFITGSGFYNKPGFKRTEIQTRFGKSVLWIGKNPSGQSVSILPRHGETHRFLPHQINHRANLSALQEMGAKVVISLTVCGVIKQEIPLATPILANDIWYLDNRLGDGSACTLFTEPGEPGRGHLLADSLLNSALKAQLKKYLGGTFFEIPEAVYGHVASPRFNTSIEIRGLQSSGVEFISQTCGPEAVLANELELPYALVGFGVNYAGTKPANATPVSLLNENLKAAQVVFSTLVDDCSIDEEKLSFDNYIYRFD